MHDGFSPTLLSRVEDACINASASPQQRWIDGWLVRYCPGKARRSRSVHAMAEGRLMLAQRMAAAAAVMHDAGLPLIFRVTPFSQPAGLDPWLAGQGFHCLDETDVMVAGEIAEAAEAIPRELQLCRLSHDDFAQQVGELRATPMDQRQSHALRLLHSPVPYQGWALKRSDDGRVLACGQVAIEADLVGVYDVFTHPAHRGQGLSRQLCAALLARARASGARTAYLQVDASNAPAQAVYRRLGFAVAYQYHYRAADPNAQ